MTLDVSVRHGQGAFTLDAAFTSPERGVTALFGPSGAGKSTLVHAIAGLVSPAEGRIVIADDVVLDTTRRIDVPAHRRRIGYVFQDGRLFPHLTVRDNLLFGARRAVKRRPAARFDDAVGLLALDHLVDRRPRGLSGGERQRVALGRALLAAPRLLLLDEPLAALDAARKAEILPFLIRIRDEARIPMVYVTHAIEEITRLADNLVLIDRGRVVAAAPVTDAMARLELMPFTGAVDAGAVIAAVVHDHDRGDRLTELRFDGGTLWVPLLNEPIGAAVRVRVRARDVLLARTRPDDTSANTILSGQVTGIRKGDEAHADVQLQIGGARLLARITRRSLGRLRLVEGAAVVAVIKAMSIESRGTNGIVDAI